MKVSTTCARAAHMLSTPRAVYRWPLHNVFENLSFIEFLKKSGKKIHVICSASLILHCWFRVAPLTALPNNYPSTKGLHEAVSEAIDWARNLFEDTSTNKICRRAPKAAHEQDRITDEIAIYFVIRSCLWAAFGARRQILFVGVSSKKIIAECAGIRKWNPSRSIHTGVRSSEKSGLPWKPGPRRSLVRACESNSNRGREHDIQQTASR